jgi:hypothetical protein
MSDLFGRPTTSRRRRLVRLALLALGLATGVIALGLIPLWVSVLFFTTTGRLAAVWYLIALEASAWIIFVASLAGTLTFGIVVLKGRRGHGLRPLPLHGLLLCISCLLALALAETLAAALAASNHSKAAPGAAEPRLPLRFNEPVGDHACNIVVLGESSAVGVPYDAWLSIGRIVVWQLQEMLPTRRFRLEVLAHQGDTLEHQHRKLAGLRVRPDVLIVYCGHNEFLSRIPALREVDHYRDDRSSRLFGDLVGLAGRASSLCALIRETTDKIRIGIGPVFREHRPLIEVPAYTPAELVERLADFRRRMETIVAYARQAGALPVLVIPPGNDAGFDPSRSFLPATTTRAERAAFEHAFRAARLIEGSELKRAIQAYRALLHQQPGFADAHYRLARLLDRSGACEEAYGHFVAARDSDGLPIRCQSSFQQAYRDVAAGRDCVLIDGQALFHAIGPRGLLDDHLFHDAVHPSLLGHIALAQAVLDALCARGELGWPPRSPAPRIDPAVCADHFGLKPPDWKLVCDRGAMFYKVTASLRYDMISRRCKERALAHAAARIGAGAAPEALGLPNVGVGTKSPTGASTSCTDP